MRMIYSFDKIPFVCSKNAEDYIDNSIYDQVIISVPIKFCEYMNKYPVHASIARKTSWKYVTENAHAFGREPSRKFLGMCPKEWNITKWATMKKPYIKI